MKMPTFISSGLVLAVTGVFAWAQPPNPASSPDARPVSVDSFWNQIPVGELGVPLGTVVRVTGVVIDGETLRSKAYSSSTMLEIQTVNGKKLAKSVLFEFEGARTSVKKPAPGDKFDYYVHEFGSFDGQVRVPEGLGIEVMSFQDTGFGYRRNLRIYAMKAEQKKDAW